MLRRVLPLLSLLAALSLAAPGVAKEAPRSESPLELALRAHIDILASDAFEGREPGISIRAWPCVAYRSNWQSL